ncbi:MAG: DUF1833 domain-containing protein [Clostridium sp.]|nr:DUF1833 domain-containing protein [Clostridium sp.]
MRTLSNNTLRAIFAQETDEIFYTLLTLDPDKEGFSPIYVYNSTETENGEPRKISHKGNEFIACPFKITLPGEGNDTANEVKLTIANVDRSITETIRSISSPILVTLEIVLSSDTEQTEAGPWNMKLAGVECDALTVEGTVIADRFLDEPFPKDKFDATTFPALF